MNKKLSFPDRYLTLWIFLAMALGIAIGALYPGITQWQDKLSIGSTNIPLAIGLILMMYPPLAKVNYGLMGKIVHDRKALGLSLMMNWVVGPLLMFALAIIFLKDYPGYRTGLILIGLARCIAMVLVWNDLAGGNKEYGAALVALNSIFQIFTYSFMAWLLITVFPSLLGFEGQNIHLPITDIAQSVAIYLGLPFLAGYLTRRVLVAQKGETWYREKFIPRISPLTLIALLLTIVFMFSFKGDLILRLPLDVLLIALPLTLYFIFMFFFQLYSWKTHGA